MFEYLMHHSIQVAYFITMLFITPRRLFSSKFHCISTCIHMAYCSVIKSFQSIPLTWRREMIQYRVRQGNQKNWNRISALHMKIGSSDFALIIQIGC